MVLDDTPEQIADDVCCDHDDHPATEGLEA
jgi:hypothetical protein